MTIVVKGVKREGLWARIQEAYDGKNAPQIARLLGKTKQTVYRWRDGEVPGIDTLAEIAQSRNVSLHWLLLDAGPKTFESQNTTGPAVNLRQANEVEPESAAQNSEELQELLDRYFAHQQLIALYDMATPRARAQILAIAKGFADPDSIPVVRAEDSRTNVDKKAS